MKKFLLLVIFFLIPGVSLSMSFVYDGFECTGSQSPSTTPKQSRIEVLEDFGNGSYRILFTGGLPLFSNSTGPCVGDAFGAETNESSNGKWFKKSDAQAMAFFTGTHLTIALSTLDVYGEGSVLGDAAVMSSMVMPHNYTWIFEFINETTSLRLIRSFESMGTVMTAGTIVPSPGSVIETIFMNSPLAFTPPTTIQFNLE